MILAGLLDIMVKKEWNAIPDRLKTLGNIGVFKVKLKEYMLESY